MEGSLERKALVKLPMGQMAVDRLDSLTADWLTAGSGHESCWHEWLQSVEQISPTGSDHLYLHLYLHQSSLNVETP